MLKTLAAKHRSTVTKMARKYKAIIITPHGPAHLLPGHRSNEQGRKPLVATVRRHPAQTAEEGGHR